MSLNSVVQDVAAPTLRVPRSQMVTEDKLTSVSLRTGGNRMSFLEVYLGDELLLCFLRRFAQNVAGEGPVAGFSPIKAHAESRFAESGRAAMGCGLAQIFRPNPQYKAHRGKGCRPKANQQ